ncbi:protein shisa-5-like [Embiotoca jacksoni]|uniref:protein shisa-5-like n=1 Tax=Embiotoca jacksoni TaxID=100190 RepID=UPI003704B734
MLLVYLLQGGTDTGSKSFLTAVGLISSLRFIIAVMVSSVLPSIVYVLCVVMVPAVWADYCHTYWDTDGVFHDTQQCGRKYCCGDCSKKYCCSDKKYHLTQEKQESCPGRPVYEKQVRNKSSNFIILVSIVVSIIPTFICVAAIICCVAPCCYKKCRNGRNPRHITVINSNPAVNGPQQLLSPPGYQPSYLGHQPSYPGYQLVPGHGGPSFPTAPPLPYVESINLAPFPAAFGQDQPMYPYQPPSQPYAPPPHSDNHVQPPYNPSYGQNP